MLPLVLTWALAFDAPQAEADMKALLTNGPRVAGTPAASQAAEYLAVELRKVGYTVEFMPFSYTRTRDLGSSLSVGSANLQANAIAGSPARRLEAPLTPVPNQGRAEDYTGLDVQGAIVVVRRGGIPFLEKARIAAERGAVGLIVVNNGPGNVRGTFGGIGPIPTVTVSQEEGEPLLGQAGARAFLEVRSVTEEVQGRDVIAKRGTTLPQAVVGAHYDSVPGALGANDNGSGTVTVLGLARELAQSPISERTWFVWFDGEEDGLWGSRRFVEQNQELVQGLRAMLNLDMVGVNVGGSLGIGGSSSLQALADCNSVQVSCGSAAEGGSDHLPFAQAGVPVLFFFRGLDPNYHKPGDTLYDVNLLADTAKVVRGILEGLFRP
jgi:hypothetical protein